MEVFLGFYEYQTCRSSSLLALALWCGNASTDEHVELIDGSAVENDVDDAASSIRHLDGTGLAWKKTKARIGSNRSCGRASTAHQMPLDSAHSVIDVVVDYSSRLHVINAKDALNALWREGPRHRRREWKSHRHRTCECFDFVLYKILGS
jgi:hypothetical protein